MLRGVDAPRDAHDFLRGGDVNVVGPAGTEDVETRTVRCAGEEREARAATAAVEVETEIGREAAERGGFRGQHSFDIGTACIDFAEAGFDDDAELRRQYDTNVFGLMVCMAGLTALVSAGDSFRWRTIGILCGFYVFSLLAKLVGRMSASFGWVSWLSIFEAYEPQRLVGATAESLPRLAVYDATLLGIGLAAYVVGGFLFCRRDLPAPL